MPGNSSRVSAIVATLLVSVSLSGCLSSLDVQIPPTLDRERTATDALPENVDVSGTGGVEPQPDTSRFVGEAEGNLVFLTRSTIREYVCVILVEPSVGSVSYGTSCGNAAGMRTANGTIEVQLTSNGTIPKDDDTDVDSGEWTVLNDDVLVRAV